MNARILRPDDILVLLFLAFACVPAAFSSPSPNPGTTITVSLPCQEAVVSVVGKGVSGTGRFLQKTTGVDFDLNVKGLEAKKEYKFHIHEKGVGAGNKLDCSKAGGHFSPASKADCTPATAKSCQIGDLVGKSQPLRVRSNGAATLSYLDPVIIIGDIIQRSLVIHVPGSTEKLACGTIVCKKRDI